MSALIGLSHRENNLGTLLSYLDRVVGTPKKVMLELPADWERRREGFYKGTFFYEKRN